MKGRQLAAERIDVRRQSAVSRLVGIGSGVISGLSKSHNAVVTTAGDHAMTKDTAIEGSNLLLGEGWRDGIEAGVRGRIRGFIEEMLEAELSQALGRGRYVRLKTAPAEPAAMAEGLGDEGVGAARLVAVLAGENSANRGVQSLL